MLACGKYVKPRANTWAPRALDSLSLHTPMAVRPHPRCLRYGRLPYQQHFSSWELGTVLATSVHHLCANHVDHVGDSDARVGNLLHLRHC